MHRHLPVCRIAALVGVGLLTVGQPAAAAPAQDKGKIAKCQDATGKWHYGDTASEACKQSKVIEINKRGIETKQIAAPLTQEEVKLKEIEKAEAEKAAKEAAERKRMDKILLENYANEGEINAMRDRKLAEIENQIKGSQATLSAQKGSLVRLQGKAKDESAGGKPVSNDTKSSIAKTEAVIAKQEEFIQAKLREQEAIKEKFDADLERFRQLKSKPTSTSQAK